MLIRTERLLLRPFQAEDLDLIYRLYSNEEIMRYMPFDLMDLSAAEGHLARILRDLEADPVLNYELAVIRQDTGEGMGRCHIQIDPDTDTGMIGWLLPVEDWNKGYATEITEALKDYCFSTLHLHRVNALCNPENQRSRRVLEKCRFRLEAHYIQKVRYIKHGQFSWEDELEYALLQSEYSKHRNTL